MKMSRRLFSIIREQLLADVPCGAVAPFYAYCYENSAMRLSIATMCIGVVQILAMVFYILTLGLKAAYVPQMVGISFVYVAAMAALSILCQMVTGTSLCRIPLPAAVHTVLVVYVLFETVLNFFELKIFDFAYRSMATLIVIALVPILPRRIMFLYIFAFCAGNAAMIGGYHSNLLTMDALLFLLYALSASLFSFSMYSSQVRRYLSQEEAREAIGALKRANEELNHLNAELEELSVTDPLTKIANRRAHDEYIEQAWCQCARQDYPMSVLMIDVDFFKVYNDSFGHLKGDECLVRIAECFKDIVRRSTDMVARYGGEEFSVILPYVSIGEALKLAEKLRAAVEELRIVTPRQQGFPYVTVSIGLASRAPSCGYNTAQIMHLADAALYRAKKEGHNRVVADLGEQERTAVLPRKHKEQLPGTGDDFVKMQTILRRVAQCTFSIDLRSGRLEFSPGISRFTGMDKTVFAGLAVFMDFVPSCDQRGLTEGIQRMIDEEEPREPVVFRVRDGRGGYRWASLIGACMSDGQGKFRQFVGAINDVTEHMQQKTINALMVEGAASYLFYYDFHSRRLWVSESLRERLGVQEYTDYHGWLGKLAEKERVALLRIGRQLKHGEVIQAEREMHLTDAGGKPLWLFWRGKISVDPDGSPALVAGTVIDTTQQVLSRQINRLIAEGSSDCVYVLNMVTGHMEFSPKIMQLTALPSLELTDGISDWASHIAPEDRESFLNSLDGIYRGSSDDYSAEYRLIGPQGEPVWVACRGKVSRDEHGAPQVMAGSIINIEGMWQYNRYVEQQSLVDKVTGLPNRVSFYREMQTRIQAGGTGHIVLLDFDDFKNLNNMYGRSTGDRVLRLFGEQVCSDMEERCALYHLGGDLFVVDLSGYARTQAIDWMSHIQKKHDRGMEIDGTECYFSFSMGAVLYTAESTVDELLSDAEIAMNRVKLRGKGAFTVFNPADKVGYLQRLQLERMLRRSVENSFEGFELYFQPLVSSELLECVGAEALLRWRREDGEMLMPGVIIPCLEKIGLMAKVEGWVLREGLAACRRWIERGAPDDFVININLTPVQITRRQLVDEVSALIAEYCLHPTNLTLEITEATCVMDMQRGLGALQALRRSGVRIAIDDFGTGYSSLSYLRELAVDEVKIDRSFIRDIEKSPEGRAFVYSVIQLSHSIGHMVCVEGVESIGQTDLLGILKADLLQGYFFGKPMPEDVFVRRFVQGEYVPER